MSLDDLIELTKQNIKALPPLDPDGTFWTNKRIELRDHILYDDLRDFLSWPMIRQTMWIHDAPYVQAEGLEVQGWCDINTFCSTPPLGNPSVLNDCMVSGNAIHTAYHLMAWEKWAGRKIKDLKHICEFGGGFGMMCFLTHRLGFQGDYYLHDFPEFSLLQSFYLSVHGIFRTLAPSPPQPVDLVTATWSLTEAPLDVREMFLEDYPADHYLIAFMGMWDGINNLEWIQNHPRLSDCRIVDSPAPNSFYAVK